MISISVNRNDIRTDNALAAFSGKSDNFHTTNHDSVPIYKSVISNVSILTCLARAPALCLYSSSKYIPKIIY
jgi:hypothetical protein